MSKFRKKPVVIDAIQFTQEMLEAHIFDGVPLPSGLSFMAGNYHRERRQIYSFKVVVDTPNGFMTIDIGDWIITGEKGEHYPCERDIFEVTYEAVERGT